jgi:hypothetical protein
LEPGGPGRGGRAAVAKADEAGVGVVIAWRASAEAFSSYRIIFDTLPDFLVKSISGHIQPFFIASAD